MSESIHSEARERVLEAAERLFAEKGYKAVTLRDIALAVGIRHASLYHHAPGGKEELFVEVTERNLKRHADGLQQALASAEMNVRAQLQAVARWLLSQPPMDLIRMTHSDMPAIAPEQAQRLMTLAYASLLEPVVGIMQEAQARGEIKHPDVGLVGSGMVGLIESLHAIPEPYLTKSRLQMAYELIDVMLHGIVI
jgi:AcrR family transcriptional regulator